MKHVFVFAALLAAASCFAAAPLTKAQQVDALLQPWQHAGYPGFALAVIQDGRIVHERGIGLADLQQDVPITPRTPFHVASISKQFTAFAIELLAQDGKLALDDDVHNYIPELPDFGAPITLRQLMHHTSGLRDQWDLLVLAGWRMDDVITEDDIMGLVKRQRALNFTPGSRHLYSNTGYTLLGIVVKRVSGLSLRDFAKARIFDPLKMHQTQFVVDYQAIVKGRASSYHPNGQGGYDYLALSFSNAGATSLSTTVEDMALWDRNFDDAKVGGKALLAAMQTPGQLNNGKKLDYASGLAIGTWHGLPTVGHGGADADFRSEYVRFPQQHLSVVLLANFPDADIGALARQIAAIYLPPSLQAAAAPAPAPAREAAVDVAKVDAMLGTWQMSATFSQTIYRDGPLLLLKPTGQPPYPLFVAGERSLFLKVVDGRFTFDAPDQDGVIQGGSYWQGGKTHRLVRVAPPAPLSAAQLAAYDGEYYSDELHVLYTVAHRDGKLTLTHPRGDITLAPVTRDAFESAFLDHLAFACNAGNCNSFTIDTGRSRNVRFTRVSLAPVRKGDSTAAPDAAPKP